MNILPSHYTPKTSISKKTVLDFNSCGKAKLGSTDATETTAKPQLINNVVVNIKRKVIITWISKPFHFICNYNQQVTSVSMIDTPVMKWKQKICLTVSVVWLLERESYVSKEGKFDYSRVLIPKRTHIHTPQHTYTHTTAHSTAVFADDTMKANSWYLVSPPCLIVWYIYAFCPFTSNFSTL